MQALSKGFELTDRRCRLLWSRYRQGQAR